MKLGKTIWISLAAGIFLILAAGLGVAYARQGQEQARLEKQVSSVETRLKNQPSASSTDGLLSQKRDLEGQLASVQSQFDDTRARLRQSTDSVSVTENMFRVAATHGVEIVRVSSSGPTVTKLKGVSFSVMLYTMDVEGDLVSLVSFISEVNNSFSTAVPESVEVSVTNATGESVATLELRFYSLVGD
ncbi:MAG: hypothetical protein AB1603_03035 [Chloroflexota bacterium]